MSLSPTEKVYHIARVRTADGEPMCLERCHIAAYLAPGLLELDLTGSLYEVLVERFRVRLDRADQTIRATVLEVDEAELLRVPSRPPSLLNELLMTPEVELSSERKLYTGPTATATKSRFDHARIPQMVGLRLIDYRRP